MPNFFFSPAFPQFFFYTSGTCIYATKRNGTHLSHSFLLASDYLSHLSVVRLEHCLYYGYLTTQGHLHLKLFSNGQLVWKLSSCATVSYAMPQFLSIQNHLVVAVIQREMKAHYFQLYTSPDNCKYPVFSLSFFPIQSYSIAETDSGLLLALVENNSQHFYYLKHDFQSEELCLKEQLDQLSEKKKAEIAHLQSLLDRTATQYNALMDVAQAYKKEAAKWRKKFLFH